MKPMHFRLPLLAAALFLAACSDSVGPGPDVKTPPPGEQPLAAVSCTADIQTQSVRCGGPQSGGASAILIGGQNQYVRLTSSNVAVDVDSFEFDVTVTNLIPQPLGSTDFATVDPEGVRVFFASLTSATGGTITVANPDGVGTFTASNQPYYQYNELIETDSTSSAKRWKLRFSPEVTSFSFVVYVAADVPYPNGFISGNPYVLTLNPGETRTLPGAVYSAVGNLLASETVTWGTSDASVVSVSGNQATAGAFPGFAQLTPSNTGRPADYNTAVSVCQATVVSNGANISESISSSDCFSAFGSSDFTPTTSYYGDLYRLTLTAGQTIDITVNTGNVLDSWLVLADPLGFPIAVNDDAVAGNVGSRITGTVGVSGTYVFEVSTFEELDQGNYTLTVTVTGP